MPQNRFSCHWVMQERPGAAGSGPGSRWCRLLPPFETDLSHFARGASPLCRRNGFIINASRLLFPPPDRHIKLFLHFDVESTLIFKARVSVYL